MLRLYSGVANSLLRVDVASSCATFSLSSSTAYIACFVGDWVMLCSAGTECTLCLHCLLGLRPLLILLLSISVMKGEDGGPPKSIMLASASCAEGESIATTVSLSVLVQCDLL